MVNQTKYFEYKINGIMTFIELEITWVRLIFLTPASEVMNSTDFKSISAEQRTKYKVFFHLPSILNRIAPQNFGDSFARKWTIDRNWLFNRFTRFCAPEYVAAVVMR